MGNLQRSLISLRRNMKQTSLLFLLMLFSGAFMAGGTAIYQGVQNTLNHFYTRPGNLIFIDVRSDNGDRVILEDTDALHQVGMLPYVRSFNYELRASAISREITPYFQDQRYLLGDGICHHGHCVHWFRGVAGPALMEIEEEIFDLVAGRSFFQEEIEAGAPKVIISDTFANLNQLWVGSIMEFELNTYEFVPWAGELVFDTSDDSLMASTPFQVEVIGIFNSAPDLGEIGDNTAFWSARRSMNDNFIYAPNRFLQQINHLAFEQHRAIHSEEDLSLWWDYLNERRVLFAAYTLYDFRDLERFETAASAILPENYWMMPQVARLAPMEAAMGNMASIGERVFVFSTGATIVLMTLLVLLFLRNRREEFGIYLALGEKRVEIIFHFIREVFIIFLPAGTLAVILGVYFSNRLSQQILLNDLLSSGSHSHMSLFANQLYISQESILASYQTAFNGQNFPLLIFLMGSAILIGLILPIIFLLTVNPKKILLK